MMRFWSTLMQAVQTSGRAASVTILTTKGSVPREPGARMVIRPDGGYHGTIGGGTLEWRAIAEAQKMLASGGPAARISRNALGPELGQCCGGSVQLLVERFHATRLEEIATYAALEDEGFRTRGRTTDGGVERMVVDDLSAVDGASLSETGEILERFEDPRRPVFLFGAGHVGRALVLAMAPLPFEVTWIDGRDAAFPAMMPENATPVASADPAGEIAGAPDDSFILVLTHSHAMDQDIVQASLEANRFPYVGLIGSKTKRARFTKRIAAAGIPATRIDRELVCPIGLRDIASKQPAAIAAGVVADLLIRDSALRAGVETTMENNEKTGAGGSA